MRMKLEVPDGKRPFPAGIAGQLSPPSSPLPGSTYPFPGTLSPRGQSVGARSSTSSAQLNTARQEQMQAVEASNVQLTNIRDRQNSDDVEGQPLHPLAMKPPPAMPPPPPPTSNPWDRRVTSIPEEELDMANLNLQRRPSATPSPRPTTSTAQRRSPTVATAFHDDPRNARNAPISPGGTRWAGAFPQSPYSNDQGINIPRSTSSPLQTQLVGSWGESVLGDRRLRHDSNPPPPPEYNAEYTHTSPQVAHGHEDRGESLYGQRRLSVESLLVDPTLRMPSTQYTPPVVPIQPIDHGLILVERDPPLPIITNKAASKTCVIGTGSSFYISKGFCEGAREVVRGGIGVKKTKKPVVSVYSPLFRCQVLTAFIGI